MSGAVESPSGSRFGPDDLGRRDRVLYTLFARHSSDRRHVRDRKQYRGAAIDSSFELHLARVYGLSWAVFLLIFLPAMLVSYALTPGLQAHVDTYLGTVLPSAPLLLEWLPRGMIAAVGAIVVGLGAKRTTIRMAGLHLRWLASARRVEIERTLPGAVRYLNALSSGSEDARTMIRKVAASRAYGETAVSLRTVLNTAQLTGSLDTGIRRVARDTPSRNLLAPFLLKFREHANQGDDALRNYLRMENRMLRYRQERARKRAEGQLELLSELFIVVLVLPALLVIVLTVMSVLAPGLSRPLSTPIGAISTRVVVVYGSAAFVVCVGYVGARTVMRLRPIDQRVHHHPPDGIMDVFRTTTTNPVSTVLVCLFPAVVCAAFLLATGTTFVNSMLLGYVGFALPVGLVALRRARIDDAKDREIKDFVHAVAEHVSLGRPFPAAIEAVAREVDLGALNDDVADLAFSLSLTSSPADPTTSANGSTRNENSTASEGDTASSGGVSLGGTTGSGSGSRDLHTAALDRFVTRIGTPLAAQSVGLVTGALNAGSDAEPIFETLQTEVGRLYHEKQALRSAMLVYVAVGWTTALLVIGIVVAVNTQVLDGFAQLSELSETSGFALDATAVDPERERYRFYVVTQATMLAAGWFAGAASRGSFEAFLHSGLLVSIAYVVFVGGGMI